MQIVDAPDSLSPEPVQATSSVGALVRFHAAAGGRVASRNAIATIGLIIIVLGSAPDPFVWLRFLALGVAARGAGSGPLIGLAAIALAIGREAVPRLTLGLGGWTRSLPIDGVQHRRGVTYGLPIIQLPLLLAALVAAVLTVVAYHRALALPKLLGVPIALVAAGAASVPARRALVSGPAFAAAAITAALGSWAMVAVSVALFVVADLVAGDIRFATRRVAVPSPATPGALRMFRFTWRAVGWRILGPLPLGVLSLAAAWFYTRNNHLVSPDVGFVARLWSTIGLTLYIGGVADIIVARRPSWPWIRSLPWSSTARAIDDAIAIGAPALIIVAGTTVVDARTVLVAVAVLPPLTAVAVALLPGARRRLTRVSGPLILMGIALGTAVAFQPLAAAVALVATPFVIRIAARRDRREIVTGWKELHHDAAGDSLAWSTR